MAVQLATSLISSVVTKCNSVSDNSDNAGETAATSGKDDPDHENRPQVMHPLRKRLHRKKAVKLPVMAPVNRRKRTQNRPESTDDDEEREEKLANKLSPKSKKLSKKRAQHACGKGKSEAAMAALLNDKKKSPMYIQLDEKDNN